MKCMCYRTKITASNDGELTCCECNYKVGGNKDVDNATSINDEGNYKADSGHKDNECDENMVCMHVLPNFMKLSILLFDFLADDVCFELASIWRRNNGNVTCSDEKNILIKECFITLASVGLTSRNEEVPNNLHEKSTPEILNTNFNVGTKKSRNLLSYNGTFTIN